LRADQHQKRLYLTESHRWIYRRVIPAELRPADKRIFWVSTESLISLSTHHRDDALARLPEARAEVEQWFGNLRQNVEAEAEPLVPRMEDAKAVAPDLHAILGVITPRPARLPAVDHSLALVALELWHQQELYRINREILNGEYPDPRQDLGDFQSAAAERY
jgi:hypothetical protein